MEAEIWAAGADPETAHFVARMLGDQGYELVESSFVDGLVAMEADDAAVEQMNRQIRDLRIERDNLLAALEEASEFVTPDDNPGAGKAIRRAIEAHNGKVWWKS